MAKDPSKTEKATPKRISKAREDGNVLTSADVNSLSMLLVGTLLTIILAPMIQDGFQQAFFWITTIDCRSSWTEQDLKSGGIGTLSFTAKILAPFCLLMFVFGALTMRMQVGKYFSTKPLKWKFNFNPKQGFSSLLPNKQNMVNLALTTAKVSLIGAMVYIAIKADLNAIKELGTLPIEEALQWILWHSFWMTIKILIIFTVIAAVDYTVRRKKYYEDLMMSKQEVKDERRNADGDPMIKGKIRQRMREIMRSQMMHKLPQADVIITNPIHVAVAIKYEIGSFAPVVVAKGLRKRAERIKEIARGLNIPIVESPPLARSLYRGVKINAYITEEFFSPVAAILAKLHRSGKRKFRHAAKTGADIAR